MLRVSPALAAARRSPRGGGGRDTPPMASRVTSTRFVGRAGELAELRAALDEAVDGDASLAFVAGGGGARAKMMLAAAIRRACAWRASRAAARRAWSASSSARRAPTACA